MGRGSNKKGSSAPNSEKQAIADTAPIYIRHHIESLIDQFRNEVINDLKLEVCRIVREMLSTTQEKNRWWNGRTEKEGRIA